MGVLKCLLVTANVGSLFEDPNRLLNVWIKQFLTTVQNLKPDFLAVHCQEVGGKECKASMPHVNIFVQNLLKSIELSVYDKVRIYLDEDYTAEDQFTALGNLYFIRETIDDAQLYDFQQKTFTAVNGREVLAGNISQVPTKEKAKFPRELFPDCVWSRKGFIRTRWLMQGLLFDTINIHLFHDADNLAALRQSPSIYSIYRANALKYTMEKFANDGHEKVPFFMFGDFNFRLDLSMFLNSLADDLIKHEIKGHKNDLSELIFKTSEDETILQIAEKSFQHQEHDKLFSEDFNTLRKYDIEPSTFEGQLLEYPVNFAPSYPFTEDAHDGKSYMLTRCPSWCDRILLSPETMKLTLQNECDYSLIGEAVCMGDHKPIYLNCVLADDQHAE